MIDWLWVKALVRPIVLPPTGLLLMAAFGLAVGSRYPRAGRALAVAGVVGVLAVSMPVVADHLLGWLDTSAPMAVEQARDAQAIVVLGGGVRRHALEYGGDTLSTLTLERVRYGAHVARLTRLPILVAGGSVLGAAPEAWLMKTALEKEFGVPVRWIEPRSRTTHENAVRSADILRKDGIHRIVLVTHGFDMRRAAAEFEAQGLAIVAAPTGMHAATHDTVFDYLPSMAGLQGSYYACYEILANLVFLAARIHGTSPAGVATAPVDQRPR
jgi:uncharacterized SAM-binding protein YcdF (DUF218 family)